MFGTRSLVLTVVLVLSLGLCGAQAGVVFLAHYNKGLDADYSVRKEATRADVVGAKLTTAKKGYPFEDSSPSAEAADIGYTKLKGKAGIRYPSAGIDTRQGTIELFVKTNWDWSIQPGDKKGSHHTFFCLPVGKPHKGIFLYFDSTRSFHNIPHFAFYIHAGHPEETVEHMINVPVGPKAKLTPFPWKKDTWHYIVASWPPTCSRLFVDGKLVAQKTWDKRAPRRSLEKR